MLPCGPDVPRRTASRVGMENTGMTVDDTFSDKCGWKGKHVYLAGVVNTWGDVTHHTFLLALICVFFYQYSALSEHDNLLLTWRLG